MSSPDTFAMKKNTVLAVADAVAFHRAESAVQSNVEKNKFAMVPRPGHEPGTE